MQLLLLLILTAASAVSASQLRFLNPLMADGGANAARVLDAKTANLRLADVGALAGDEGEFVRLEHENFKGHSVRIKETTGWCDPDVKSFTGYLDVGHGKDLFFYFFESRHKPEEDDVMMWINGGPGCSSSLGLFMELGPCSIVDGEGEGNFTTQVNPYAWNERANVFFLDEPIGVGFSYAENGQTINRAETAAVDVQAFIAIFFETFQEFKGRKLHLAGESYGGRYLPVFASAIYDGNKALMAAGGTAINLKSVMIGNGLTDPFSMIRGYYLHSCTSAPGVAPILGVTTCQGMALALPQCETMMKKECIDRFDAIGCNAAYSFCQEQISTPFWNVGLNPYDISQPCTREELADGLCYGSVTKKINKYLDLPHVRALLGVSPEVGSFQSCSGEVGLAFNRAGDTLSKTWFYVAALLEHGVNVLAYVGKFDWICNASGNEIWTSALQWTGHDAFNNATVRDWHVEGKVAGQTRHANGLTFLTVNDAGHMVPYDKPKESLQMLNHWLAGKDM